MNCPRCGEVVQDGSAFCQFCGMNLSVRRGSSRPNLPCATCGELNPPGTNYCRSCGARLHETSSQGGNVASGVIVDAGPAVDPGFAAPRGARLVAVRRDGSDGPSFDITSEQFDIGRSEADLLFDDPHMAPRHARITYKQGQYILTPLEQRNGVYVQVHQPTEMADGDTILLGKQVLRFEVPPDVERTLRPATEHGVVLFGTPAKPPWGRLRQLTAAGTTRDVYHLTRSDVVLGREQGDVVFSDDEFLSRRHAQLQFRGGRVSLQDLGSSNGTFLRLRAQHLLMPGELVRMGDELLRFEIG